MGEVAYRVYLGDSSFFEEHRHADLEFNYVLKGSLRVMIGKKVFQVNEGELSLIAPMVSHGTTAPDAKGSLVLTVIVGASFLKSHFSGFTHGSIALPVCRLNPENPAHQKLRELLVEMASLSKQSGKNASLMLTGDLYKVCAYLLDEFVMESGEKETGPKDLRAVANVEKALDLIYYHYADPITVEDAAQSSGYGKSNFCKVFKKIVGETFHSALNRQRVENSCVLLRETALSIGEIALQVGFTESKSFCRVFRQVMGQSPGSYRKNV